MSKHECVTEERFEMCQVKYEHSMQGLYHDEDMSTVVCVHLSAAALVSAYL